MKKRQSRRWLLGITVLFLAVGLSGCYIVEPEKRAYPLVAGLDWKGGDYQVYLAMAQLAESTGQGKEGGEEQEGDGTGALLLTGGSGTQIREKYNQSRELYLDPGHIQAVILGAGLYEKEERLVSVLEEMERDTSLGNSAYVFRGDDLKGIFDANGVQVETIGKFLTGIYENRTWKKEKPVTLARMYRELHNEGKIVNVPEIFVNEKKMWVEKDSEERKKE